MLFDREQLPCIGVVLRPHGLKGVLCVRAFALFRPAIQVLPTLIVYGAGALCEKTVLDYTSNNGLWHVKLQGVSTRTQAEALHKAQLLAHPDALVTLSQHVPPNTPTPQAQGNPHALWDAILGCSVQTETDEVLGEVEGVFSTGANDVLEVRPNTGGKVLLVPWIEQVVRSINLAKRQVCIRPLEGMQEMP